MRLKFVLHFFILIFSLVSLAVSAQTLSVNDLKNVKVSQLSDQQIMQLWQKLQSSGMSESQAIQVLTQRGLPMAEVTAFQQRVASIQSGVFKTPANTKAVIRTDTVPVKRDSVAPVRPPVVKKKSPVYGYDFFNNSSLNFEPNLRIATPKGYVLGPGDEVLIMLTGLNEATVNRTISPDGAIQIPYAGLVYLNGFTIEQAIAQIRSKMTRVYPGLSSGQTQLTVNLGKVRSIRVTIIGEATKPGTYTISSLATFFNALYLSGGPNMNGSLRNIEIIRNNKTVQVIDFYTFLQKGISEGNIRLEDQDVIRIPVYLKRVNMEGEIKRPGLYELRDTETLEDLIRYAGGFSDIAYRSSAKVVQNGEKERNIRDVPSGLFDRFVPKNADSVYFEAILQRYTNRVTIQGAVFRPGTFELSQGLTLSQLIKKADGLRPDAFLANGYIKRIKSDRDKELVSFDLRNIMSGAGDIALQREDSVIINSGNDLKDELNIRVAGFVRNPGTFVFRQGMKLNDVIAMAGGFTPEAASHNVQVSRLLKNRADTLSNQLLKVISLSVDSVLQGTDNTFLLEPLDYIYVPRLVNYHTVGNVNISGEVLYPGNYALQRRDETVLEVLHRAGDITPLASLNNTIIYRNGLRVDMNLAASTKKTPEALILYPGDSILVRRSIPFVEVSGAVNNPQILRFTSKNFSYYISSAGGVKETGRLKGAFVQYPNGINKPVGKFLFFRNYPRVLPGSKIIVPEKVIGIPKISFGEIGAITSALTALISLIAILGK